MDEIQDCIADAQFGEVLRGREHAKPNMRIPNPPPDFDPVIFAHERKIDFEFVMTQPVGVYLMTRFNRESRHIYGFLSELNEFKQEDNPDPRAYNALMGRAAKLPPRFRPSIDEVAHRFRNQILPQLRSTPSMGLLKFGTENPQMGKISVGPLQLDDIDIGPFETVADDPTDTNEESEKAEQELARKRKSMNRHRQENKLHALELFEQLRSQLVTDQINTWKAFCDSDGHARLMRLLWYCEQPVTLDSFNIFRDLGRGAFGVVSGAKFRATGSLIALKCMNKKLVKGKNALKLVKAEREVLAKLGEHPSPFTVYLQYSFQDKETFYLALPLCTGGDLQYHLAVDKYFSADRAKFHIAEVVLGVAHLHALGILYRDLKPDNILLDEEGHCRISDMGLAIVTNGKPIRGRAGTPGYWSPEMITKKRYSYATDWWSLGCVLYELLSGRCPFSKLNSRMERDDATLKWKVSFPDRLGCGINGERRPFPDDAKMFIAHLLERDKLVRLGSSERGAEDVKEHPYFGEVNWSHLARKEIPPPFKPREAINAFNQSDIDGKSNEHDYRKLKLEDSDQIEDFDFISTIGHQQDLVSVLKLQDEGKLAYLEKPDPMGCCVVS